MIKRLNINKASVIMIVFNSLQLIIIVIALVYASTHQQFKTASFSSSFSVLLLFVIILIIINSLITIRDRYVLSRLDKHYQLIQKNITHIENLNNTLRAQRHDFLNHLQVVYGLMELEEYKDAADYIGKIYNDIHKVGRFLKTSYPAVNALLQAKILSCDSYGIKVDVKVTSQLKSMRIDSWELCRVLGNILDNSIYALGKRESDRYILIEIYEDITSHKFKITNNGPMIDNNLFDKIFQEGFSTKGEEGEGMGLSIVMDIIRKHSGTIDVRSDENETAFEVSIPR